MALFNRRNNQNQVPAEIQEYYQSERRERAGVAWLLAIGTLIVTVLIAAGIFFAGRWAYRQVAGDDEPAPQTAQNEDQKSEQQQEPADDNQNQDQNQDQPADEPEPTPAPSDTNNDQPTETPAQDEPDQPANDTPADNNDDDAPATGSNGGGATSSTNTDDTAAADDDKKEVASAQTGKTPETGPGSTLAIFLGVSVFGYIAHRIHGRRLSK